MERSTQATDPAHHASYELAALRLHLAIGMAVADDELDEREEAGLCAFIAECDVDTHERVLLGGLLQRLINEPPSLEVLLRKLVNTIHDPAVAQLLLVDLATMARVDRRVDPREEGLLRLVCGALHIDPVSLYDDHERAASDATAADLARLVRMLLDLDELAA